MRRISLLLFICAIGCGGNWCETINETRCEDGQTQICDTTHDWITLENQPCH